MWRHHSSACHHFDPIRAVLELLTGRFDHVGYAVTHGSLSTDPPEGHPVATTPMSRGKITVPASLRQDTATQQQPRTVDIALFHRFADLLGRPARITHCGESCC